MRMRGIAVSRLTTSVAAIVMIVAMIITEQHHSVSAIGEPRFYLANNDLQYPDVRAQLQENLCAHVIEKYTNASDQDHRNFWGYFKNQQCSTTQ